MTQDIHDVNEYAQKKFVELRHKLKLDVQKPILKKAVTLTQEHIDKMTDMSQASDANHARATFDGGMQEAVEAARNVDNVFDFIDKLQLPTKLSLAIGLIIAGSKTKNTDDLHSAARTIREFADLLWEKNKNDKT